MKEEMDIIKGSSEDRAIYAPIEDIRNIEKVIKDLEITRKELQKVAEGMRPIKV